jgi:hypothetical protein
MDVDVETTVEKSEEMSYYIGWIKPGDPKYRIHSYRDVLHTAYDAELSFTENYLPLHRNSWAGRMYHREPHDTRQNPLHFIRLVKNEKNEITLQALDELDAKDCMDPMYDTKLRRVVVNREADLNLAANLPLRVRRHIVQMRFEDGQYSGYQPEELHLLREWIAEQKNPADLEHYFVHEVLRNRPEDKARYPFSQLRSLFNLK